MLDGWVPPLPVVDAVSEPVALDPVPLPLLPDPVPEPLLPDPVPVPPEWLPPAEELDAGCGPVPATGGGVLFGFGAVTQLPFCVSQ